MKLARLRPAEWLAAVCGIALLVAVFLPWYEAAPDAESTTFSGWESYAVVDVLVVIGALTGLGLALMAAMQPSSAIPIAWASIGTTISFVVLIFVALSTAGLPDLGGEERREIGIWITLAASVGLFASMLWSMRDGRSPGLSMKPGTEIEQLPAPNAHGS